MVDPLARQFSIVLLEGVLRLVAEIAALGALDRAAIMRIERSLTRALDLPRHGADPAAAAWVQQVTERLAQVAAGPSPRR